MEEKILQVLNDLIKGKNLRNLSERTMKEYAKAIAPTITSEEGINDAFKTMQTTILTSMNGQLNADNKASADANKAEYERMLEEYKTNNPKPIEPTKPTEDNPQIVEMQKQIEEMRAKEALREKELNRVNLINGIKGKFNSEDKDASDRFGIFLKAAYVNEAEDVDTNFTRINDAFTAIERSRLDSSVVRPSSVSASGLKPEMFDDLFPPKE